MPRFPYSTQIAKLQDSLGEWAIATFGKDVFDNAPERGKRLIEEALEYGQTQKVTKEQAHLLVDYVFSRPVGDPAQEMGGVMVTALVAAQSAGLDAGGCLTSEMERIHEPTIMEKIRSKQVSKELEGVGMKPSEPAAAPVLSVRCGWCEQGYPRMVRQLGDNEKRYVHELPEPGGTIFCSEVYRELDDSGVTAELAKTMDKLYEDKLHIYASSMFSCSVCVPKTWTPEEVVKRVNAEHPCGTASGWVISKDEKFASGHSNPCKCGANRLHYLLDA